MATDCTQCVSYEKCKPHMTNASYKTPNCPSFEQKPTECEAGGPCTCSPDLLTEMFHQQAALNKKYGFVPGGMMVRQDRRDLHDGEWLNKFITAMDAELVELRDCTIWKHWYKEAREGKWWLLTNREHAKVEVVDLMFFLMSMAQAVGLTAQDMYDLYMKKLGLNHQRRDDDCTQQEAKGYKLEDKDA